MAADVCSEMFHSDFESIPQQHEILSLGSSPRISFSYDHNQIDNGPIQDNFHFDFNFSFCNDKGLTQEISPADELFSDGKILPIEIKIPISKQKQVQIQNSEPNPSHQKPHSSTSINDKINVNDETKKKRLKELLCSSFELEEEKPFLKIFRQLRRSTSLNVETGRTKRLIRPLQFLYRSNSTGSALEPKQNVISNICHRQNSIKQSPFSLSTSSSSSSSSAYYPYNSSERPPLKKNRRAHGNRVRITPILHISQSCLAFGNVSLFRFGSLFCTRKMKKKKK